MHTSLRFITPAALLLSVALLSPVRAQTPAVSFSPGFTGFTDTAANEGVASYNLGYTFSVNAPIIVTALGYYSEGAYTTTHDVGLYSSAGTLLLSGTVSNADPLTDFFRYTTPNLTDFALLPGQTYTLAGVTGANDPFFFGVQTQDGTASALNTAPQINFGGAVSTEGSTLTDNNFQADPNANPGTFGPNFQFAPAPVPEASTLVSTGLLLCLGLGSWAVTARRRRAVR